MCENHDFLVFRYKRVFLEKQSLDLYLTTE